MNELVKAGVENQSGEARYAYIAPYLKQARQIAWDQFKRYAGQIPGTQFNESDLRVDLPDGQRIQLFGGDNAHALRGMHFDGVALDEYADMSPEVWTEILRPALARKRGFALFIGTPRGRNHFFDLYEAAQRDPEWYATVIRASESGALPPEELERAKRQMPPDEYAQEYECSFEAAVRGAYYGEQFEATRRDGRIREVAWLAEEPVNTYWDLGFDDATAIIFAQKVGREVRIIDYLEDSGQTLTFYAKRLAEKPYVYGRHYLPHDAGHEEIRTGKSMAELLKVAGVRPITVLPRLDVLDGISAARQLFSRVYFDAVKCQGLLNALAAYRKEWDEKRQVYKDKPLHDWASHGADAFRYLALAFRDQGDTAQPRTIQASTAFNPLTHGYPKKPAGVGAHIPSRMWR